MCKKTKSKGAPKSAANPSPSEPVAVGLPEPAPVPEYVRQIGARLMGAKVKTAKPAKGKAAKVAAIAENLTERELLLEQVKWLCVIAERVEYVRRTLWRMSEVREYENKGAKGKPETAQDKPDAAKGGAK